MCLIGQCLNIRSVFKCVLINDENFIYLNLVYTLIWSIKSGTLAPFFIIIQNSSAFTCFCVKFSNTIFYMKSSIPEKCVRCVLNLGKSSLENPVLFPSIQKTGAVFSLNPKDLGPRGGSLLGRGKC